MQDKILQENNPTQKTPTKDSLSLSFIHKATKLVIAVYIFGFILSSPFNNWLTSKDVDIVSWAKSGVIKSIAWPYYAYKSMSNSVNTNHTKAYSNTTDNLNDKLSPFMLQESIEITLLNRTDALDKVKALGFNKIKTQPLGEGLLDKLAFSNTTDKNPYIGAFMFTATDTKKVSLIWYAFHPKYDTIAKNFMNNAKAVVEIDDVTSQEANIYYIGTYMADDHRKFVISIRDEVFETGEHLYLLVYDSSR